MTLHEIDVSHIPLEERQNDSAYFVYVFKKPVDKIPKIASPIRRYLYPLVDVATQYRRGDAVRDFYRSKNYIEKAISKYNKRLGINHYNRLEKYSSESETKKLQVRRNNLVDALEKLEMPRGENFITNLQENNITLLAQVPNLEIEANRVYLYYRYNTDTGIVLDVYIEASSKVPMVISKQISSSGLSNIIDMLYITENIQSASDSSKSRSEHDVGNGNDNSSNADSAGEQNESEQNQSQSSNSSPPAEEEQNQSQSDDNDDTSDEE